MSMASTTAPPSDTAERELVITRLLDAPPALVFRMWTDPAHLVRWLGPRGFHGHSAQLDLRPGGAWRAAIRSPEGRDHVMQGVYREILADERLVFTFAWLGEDGAPGHQTLVTIGLAAEGPRTRMTFHQAVFETVESRDAHLGGWSSCLDRLVEAVAQV
jgi:uncharacterized protein YndB with AHSA1/START domain